MVYVFSDDDERFGKTNEFMNPVTGTITSLLSKEELVSTFEPSFTFDKLAKNSLRYLLALSVLDEKKDVA